jgi:aminoglycoside phosphotransferase (APT) family kinase protein
MTEDMAGWVARLRRRPPQRALDWVATAVGSGARIAAVRPLRGGVTNAMHLVAVERGGEQRWLVLRRFFPDMLSDGTAAREAAVLEVLGTADVPAPRLVAVDPDGSSCDVPALLITRLDGWARLPAQASPAWIDSLAATLAAVHQAPITHAQGLPQLTEGLVARLAGPPPPWFADRPEEDLRLRQLAGRHLGDVDGRAVLLHNDYWSGNTLRRGQRVVGVVDWSLGGIGHPGLDVGYCHMDLLLA